MPDDVLSGADQATADTVAEATQPETGNESSQTGAPAGGAVAQPSEIVVGNQKFRDVSELVRAYENAQKGLTQSTQKYAKQIKAYEGVTSWLKGLQGD